MTSVVFDVSKKVGLSQSLEYYGANVQTTGRSGGERYDVRVSEMIREACAKVDQDTDFSKYDYVFVYYAGYSESEGASQLSSLSTRTKLRYGRSVISISRLST